MFLIRVVVEVLIVVHAEVDASRILVQPKHENARDSKPSVDKVSWVFGVSHVNVRVSHSGTAGKCCEVRQDVQGRKDIKRLRA